MTNSYHMALTKLTQQALAVKRLLLGSILCEGTVLTQHSVNVSFDILENISTFLSMGITTNPGADWVHDRFIVTDWPVDPVPSNFPYMYSAPLGWSDDRFEGWFSPVELLLTPSQGGIKNQLIEVEGLLLPKIRSE